MIDGLDSLYQQLAQSIHVAIKDDWISAQVDAIFYDESSSYFGEYVRKSDSALLSFATDFDGGSAIRQIRRKFSEAGKPLWGQFCFQLNPDGVFNVKFGYENCDNSGNTIFDAEEYQRQHDARRQRYTA